MNVCEKELQHVSDLLKNIGRVIVGKTESIRMLVTALLAGGHVLIEDIPGIGKTSLARALALSVSCSFKRIQFTPDLLPSDITGLSIYDQDRKEFVFQPGPIFANIVLADEINRTSPRTQAALLESMNESHVTIDGITRPLPHPFMVIATQNPLEFTGTYPLPESQLDRFLMILRLGYPTPDEEEEILRSRREQDPLELLEPVVTSEDVANLCKAARNVAMTDELQRYIINIADRTRSDEALIGGLSPRGTLHLSRTVRAHALVQGREYALPEDVQAVVPAVLAHRLIERKIRPGQGGRFEIEKIIRRILKEVPVPT